MSEFIVDKNVTTGNYRDIEWRVWKGVFNSGLRQLCGYVRIPDSHPFIALMSEKKIFNIAKATWGMKKMLAEEKGEPFDEEEPVGHDRENYSYEKLPIEVHGGLTFGQPIDDEGKEWHQNFTPGWWIGWDYLHLGDEMYDLEILKKEAPDLYKLHTGSSFHLEDKLWTEEEVIVDCKDVIDQIIRNNA